MPFDKLGLPVDGSGKALAMRKLVGAGPAGEDLYVEVDIYHPDNAVGHNLVSQPLAELPTNLAPVVNETFAIEHLYIVNTTADFVNVRVTDGAGTPLELVPQANPLPGGAALNLALGGIELVDGLQWAASAAGVNGAFKGYKATP